MYTTHHIIAHLKPEFIHTAKGTGIGGWDLLESYESEQDARIRLEQLAACYNYDKVCLLRYTGYTGMGLVAYYPGVPVLALHEMISNDDIWPLGDVCCAAHAAMLLMRDREAAEVQLGSDPPKSADDSSLDLTNQ